MEENTHPSGFIKLIRSDLIEELAGANPNAFILLTMIAFRARRTSAFNRHHLAIGEALIADFATYGLTEQKYRTAKQFLEEHGFATFKPTGKGTIAKLCDTRVFDINPELPNGQSNGRPTDGQRTGNGQLTTINNVKNWKKGKIDKNDPKNDRGRRSRPLHRDEVDAYASFKGYSEECAEKFWGWNNPAGWKVSDWRDAFDGFAAHFEECIVSIQL